MAQLKDLMVTGPSRLIGEVTLTQLSVPTASNGTTLGLGTDGQVLATNSSSVYWLTLGTAAAKAITDKSAATAIGNTDTNLITARAVYYGLPTINNAHNYTSSTTIYAPTAGGTANYILWANGATSTPTWKAPKDALNYMINTLDTGSSVLTANDYMITQYVGGGTTTTTYHRRAASAIRVGGLLTARKLGVALSSTTAVTFDGTADQTSIPISGILDIAHGGTGKASWTQWGVVYASDSTTLAQITAGATTNKYQFLQSKGAAAPEWAAVWNLSDAGVTLANNTDADSLTYGVSHVVNSTAMKTIAHNPAGGNAGSGGTFYTMHGYSENYDRQFLYDTSNGVKFRRKNQGTWQPWRVQTHIPYGADVGSETTPTYVEADGEIKAGTALGESAYHTDSYFALASHGTHVTYGTSATAIETTAAAGTATTVSRSDHKHSISLATGDSNGQVKIAGTNVTVKGINESAYHADSYFVKSITSTDNAIARFNGTSGAIQNSTVTINDNGTIITGNFSIGGVKDTNAGKTFSSNSTIYLTTTSASSIVFTTNNVARCRIDYDNNFRPETNRGATLGTSSYYWNGAYINGNGSIHWNNLAWVTGAEVVASSIERGIPKILSGNDLNVVERGSRLWGMSPQSILVENTTDSGTTWTTATVTDRQKRGLTNGEGFGGNSTDGIGLGGLPTDVGSGNTQTISAGIGQRITIDLQAENRINPYIYCFDIYVIGRDQKFDLLLERYNKYTDAWTTVYTTSKVALGLEHRVIYPTTLPQMYGNGSSSSGTAYRFNKLRLTVVLSEVVHATSRYCPYISKIGAWGNAGLVHYRNSTYPSGRLFDITMAQYGQPYYLSDRNSGNITVPASQVTIYGVGGYNAASTDVYATLVLGNNGSRGAAGSHSEGRIFLYSASTAAHVIKGISTSSERTHYFPDATGWIATGGNGTSTGAGDTTHPIFLSTAGVLTQCSGTLPYNISGTAGAVAWTNITGKPTNVGNATLPVYLNSSGVLTACSTGTVGHYLRATATGSEWTSQLYSHDIWILPQSNNGMEGGQLNFSKPSTQTLDGMIDLYSSDNTNTFMRIGTPSDITMWLNITNHTIQATGDFYASKVYNAVWNDYAEYRRSKEEEPGRVVVDTSHKIMERSTTRLQPGAHIISDTYGNSVGMSDEAKTPIGIAGRVLAYTYQDRNNYHIGDAVCAAPNGTIDIMTREEIIQYPDRIIGIVSEIPDYEFWDNTYTNEYNKYPVHTNIKVNGRIWVYVR